MGLFSSFFGRKDKPEDIVDDVDDVEDLSLIHI